MVDIVSAFRKMSTKSDQAHTAPIVLTTFKPIFERLGDQTTPEQILDLKVCDPAMGSGAFLVEACRLLAERLVRAWEVHKSTPKAAPRGAERGAGAPASDELGGVQGSPPFRNDEDVLTYARRLVAERCLFGVDKNIFAVDLAKLSLWLATLARDHSFTFLDHALRHGDSLVGLSREQIACFSWEVEQQMPLLRSLIDERVAEAQMLREQIQGLATSDDVPEKARLLREANEALHDVRHIGDLVVSAFFERDKPKDRHLLRTKYAADVQAWLGVAAGAGVESGFLGRRSAEREGGSPDVSTFHWEIEFPEVFTRSNGGFDVFVGNPPFAGGTLISGALGKSYLDWLYLVNPESGNRMDLVGYFFRRAFELSRTGGAAGLLATNTIAQGDTRKGTLSWLCRNGAVIFEARRRIRWPGAAAVVVSAVHFSIKFSPTRKILNGQAVRHISPFLVQATMTDDPVRLRENAGVAYEGAKPYGQGFVFDDADEGANPVSLMRNLVRRNPANQENIYPYIGGEEVNESPTHAPRRWIINFGSLSLEEAKRWPDLLAICESRVRPERARKAADVANWPWWQFWRTRDELYQAIRGLGRVLVNSSVGDKLSFAFQPPNRVFSHALNVFAFGEFSQFAMLQSSVHAFWARLMGSSMKDDLRYTPSDCFETFPFPERWESIEDLERAGREYYDFRAALMVRNNEGLTKTYNRFHDPDERDADILKLRNLHAAMDRAVLDTYGWTDIQPRCEFILDYEDEEDDNPGKPSKKRKPYRYRWPDEIRDEVLGRLLELNAQRAKEEALAGSAVSAAKAARPKVSRGREKADNTPLLD